MTVALVLVSHVAEIAEGVRRLAAQMAPDVTILPAAGTDDGEVGTSFDKVFAALGEAQAAGGTVVLYDLGSALLTAETAVEMLDDDQVRIVDAPLVEGALAAATAAQGGAGLAEVAEAAQAQGGGRPADDRGAGATRPGPDTPTAEVTLRNKLGLHARPAADLARMVTGMDAEVLIQAPDGAWVDTRSVVAVIGLGLRGGDTVRIATGGTSAEESLDRVVALVGSGFGEVGDEAEQASSLTGVAVSPGVAEGPAVLVVPTSRQSSRAGTIDVEAQRLATAIEAASTQLDEADEVFRTIASAHQTLLNDPMLRGRASALVGRGRAAVDAWGSAVDEAHTVLAGVSDSEMADRAADVRDVGGRVMSALLGRDYDAGLPKVHELAGAVVVAEEMLPSQVVRAHAHGASGLLAARGGSTAHAAQLARSLGLPAVFGAGEEMRTLASGQRVRVDGNRGVVEVH